MPNARLTCTTLRVPCLCIDTVDPDRLAGFWQTALGWRRTHVDADEVVLEPPAGSPEDGNAPDLLFLRVPEAKVTKNRLHFDLRPQDQLAAVTPARGPRRPSRRRRPAGHFRLDRAG